jgi:hypothetical protein
MYMEAVEYCTFSAVKRLRSTSLLNIITAKRRPSLDAQNTRAVYKKRYTLGENQPYGDAL